jgi:hypothetical protein
MVSAQPRTNLSRVYYPSFFLGWQNELEQVLFESGEIGFRIASKATATYPLLTTAFKCLAQGLPGMEVVGHKFLSCEGPQPRGGAGVQADGAT